MAKTHEVLGFLIPNGGYVSVGDEYEGIEFIDCDPISKEEFEAGFVAYDAWKAEKDAEVSAAKESAQAKLAALGLTTEDLKALVL